MRKLALIGFGYSAAVVAAQFIVPVAYRPLVAAVLAALALFALLLNGDARTRAFLVIIPACIGMLWSWGHYMLFLRPGDALDGETVTVTVTATDYSEDFGTYSRVYARLSGDDIPNVQTAVYSYNYDMPALSPGDSFVATLKLSSAIVSHDEETAMFSSRGIYLRAYVSAEIDVNTVVTAKKARYIPRYFAHYISEKIDACFPADTAAFFKSLMLGDRTELKENLNLYNAMAAAGLLHVIAISGMHVAFLVGVIQRLVGKSRLSTIICIPIIFFFVLMTGGSPSVIRAAVMQTFVLSASLFRRENDPITSMAAALMLLLIKNPAACAAASLQLSFSAIFGIALVSGRCYNAILPHHRMRTIKRRSRRLYRVCNFFVTILSSSVGAMCFSLPLVALNFGYVSLYSLIANIFCMWCVSLLFCGGFAACVLYCVFQPLGSALAIGLSFLARYVFAVVKIVAALPYSTLYLGDGTIVAWLIASYGLFALCYFLRGKSGFRPLMPISLCIIMLCSILLTQGSEDIAAVVDVGQGLCTVITSGDVAAVIDCGGTYTSNPARSCAAMLFSQGQKDIDLLALTHLHSDHCNGVKELFSLFTIKALALPEEPDDSDGLLDEILECASEQGTEVYYISDGSIFSAGDMEIESCVLGEGSNTNETGAVYRVSVGEFDALITGDAGISTENAVAERFNIDSLELLVVGHHGSSGSSGGVLLSQFEPEYAVVSVGKGNAYGHPTDEALERLVSYGATVFRTDEAGDVVFRIG